MNEQTKTLAPSTAATRIALLDIFRGFALFGIFMVNIRYMSSSTLHLDAFKWMTEGPYNKIVTFIYEYFFDSKFFPIFSFLFGVGFGMQMNKMEEKGNFSIFFFIRRYFFLLLFGVFHVVFLWGGDVLILYALAGFLVMLIRRIPSKFIFIGSILILLCPLYGHILSHINNFLVQHGCNSIIAIPERSYQELVNFHSHGSFVIKLKRRLFEYTVYYRNVEYFPSLLFLIFGGYLASRYKFYNKISETLRKLSTLAIAAVIVIAIVRFVDARYGYLGKENYKLYVIITKLKIIASIAQSFLYLYIISYLYKYKFFLKLMTPLSYAGRMSLTNYIMQSVLGMILFSGSFIGLYGKLGNAWLGLIAFTSYFVLVGGSKLWLNKFRYGPLEFIWRELTYKTSLKFLRNGNNTNSKQ
jgi:uncharacterized protein